uniref:Uncharacterized protein n=1 Tax=Alexandrium monilatum TaxID=311494 RepID=A0A7S4SPG5_9DINO
MARRQGHPRAPGARRAELCSLAVAPPSGVAAAAGQPQRRLCPGEGDGRAARGERTNPGARGRACATTATSGPQTAGAEEGRNFQDEVVRRLAAGSPEALDPAEDEAFFHVLRSQELDGIMRLSSALKLAHALAERGQEVALHSAVEFETQLRNAREILLVRPHLSIELAQVCEASRSLVNVAALVYEELEQDALQQPAGKYNQYCYVLVDLADWRARCGQWEHARRLLKVARGMPPSLQDPRVFPCFYAWRFDSDSAVPRDGFRVEAPRSLADAELPIMRPLPHAHRSCPCSRRAIQSHHSASEPALAGDSPGGAQRARGRSLTSASAFGGRELGLWQAAPGPMSTAAEEEGPRCLPGALPRTDAQALPPAPLRESLCRELDRRFNVGGCLLGLGDPPSPWSAAGPPALRVRAVAAAARRLVKARRFAVRVVDSEAGDNAAGPAGEPAAPCVPGEGRQGSHRCVDVEMSSSHPAVVSDAGGIC